MMKKPIMMVTKREILSPPLTVHEKWTIFAMPYFAINSDNWSVNLIYMKMPKAVGDIGFNILGMFMNRNIESTEQTGNDLRSLTA